MRLHGDPPDGAVPQDGARAGGAEARKVATPGADTIDSLALLLDVPKSRTAKVIFVVAEEDGLERFVFAVVRGDMDLNQSKLANAVGASALRPARLGEIRTRRAEPVVAGHGTPAIVTAAKHIVKRDATFHPYNAGRGWERSDQGEASRRVRAVGFRDDRRPRGLWEGSFGGGSNGERGAEAAEVHGVASGVGERTEATVGASSEVGWTKTLDSLGRDGGPDASFVTDRLAGGGDGREANRILAVRFGEHEDYERVVLDLGTGAEPARTASEWTLTCSTKDGTLRVAFPSVAETRVSNGPLGGSLLKSFYMVRAPEEGMFVDFFVREGFRYRVLELSDPARIAVDFRPSGDPLKTPLPARGGNTVLVEPRRGDEVGDPFTVSGYSRNPEAANSVVLTGSDGAVKVQKTVHGNDWTATWGYFETTLDPSPLEKCTTLEKRAILQVGAHSASDGSFEGIEIPVRGGQG